MALAPDQLPIIIFSAFLREAFRLTGAEQSRPNYRVSRIRSLARLRLSKPSVEPLRR